MKAPHRRRPSASVVLSCLALFVALGGTVYASSTINGKTIKKSSLPGNRVKKNTLPGNRVKNRSLTGKQVKGNSLTGSQINEATLGQVPSAANATNAVNVGTVKTFSAGANSQELVSLVKTPNFELMGFCDPNDEAVAPGLVSARKGTVMVIYNRSTTTAFADSSDDENYRMGLNEAIGFNYQDNGDGGLAMSSDGHFLAVPSWGNEVADTSFVGEPTTGSDYSFATACHFAGAALVG